MKGKLKTDIDSIGFSMLVFLFLRMALDVLYRFISPQNEVSAAFLSLLFYVIRYGLTIFMFCFFFPTDHKFEISRPYVLPTVGGVSAIAFGVCVGAVFNALLDLIGIRSVAAFSAFPQSHAGLILTFLLSCVITPLFEELLFRGIILSRLANYGAKTAILISALIFGLSHFAPELIVFATVSGIVLGVAAQKFGLATSFCIHALYNLLTFIIQYIKTGKPYLADKIYLAYIIIAVIASVYFIPSSIRRGKTLKAQNADKKEYISAPLIAFVIASFILILSYIRIA
ncbi:MAG: CPBP family intramembrane metalloprotease [Clostridia bacterium]|nr:CPBP family intramembrane metalloprotease [Clostridia bacterium]